MTYSPLLDAYFGSPWLSLGSIVFVAVAGLLLKRRLFDPSKHKVLLGGLYTVVLFGMAMTVLFLNAALLGLGTTVAFTDIAVDGRSVAVLDYRMEAGGEGSDPVPHHRVHLLELETGEPLFRRLVGSHARILALTDAEIIHRRASGELVYVRRRDGEIAARFGPRDVADAFPQLAGGGSLEWKRAHESVLELLSNDGRTHFVSILNRSLLTELPPHPTPGAPRLAISDDGRRVGVDRQPLLSFQGKTWDDRRPKLDKGPQDVDFLDPRFVAVSEGLGRAVILHFDTLEHRRPTLTAVSLQNGQLLWTLPPSALRPGDPDDPAEPVFAQPPDGYRFVMALDATIAMISIADGSFVWSQRF